MSTSTNSEIDAINKFILYNAEATQPWVTLHCKKRIEGNRIVIGKS
jgi:hypothetical protein